MPDGFTRAPKPRRYSRMAALVAAAAVASTVSLMGVHTAHAASYTLLAGQSLSPNQYLMGTNPGADGQGLEFILQSDGNPVLYTPAPDSQQTGQAIWWTGTYDPYTGPGTGDILFMQGDGNLVLRDVHTGNALWNSQTGGHPNAAYHLDMQNDGNLVIYGPNGALWATWTYNANNTPSFGGGGPGNHYYGTCLSTTNNLCRNTWSSGNRIVHFRAVDQFSSTQPGWTNDAQAAVDAWNNSPGPQFYCLYPEDPHQSCGSTDTYIYLNDSSTGQNDLMSGSWGITWNCYSNRTPACTDNPQAGTVVWTNVYLNHDLFNLSTTTGADRQHTIAHESGHGMLLAHNSMDANALMWPSHNTRSVGPNSNDIGASATCANAGFGMRCIYGSS